MAGPLESYAWDHERETARAHTGDLERHGKDARSDFERDRARIIHSVAFRRLQGKTQIFAPGSADHMRSRVTHSIEVSQIGRGIAAYAGVPESLVEAACLAHDLGHPPFGHTGEQALDRLMENHGGYEGNAQSFRIVTRLEQKHRDYEGLDLCRATLLALLKYPYTRDAGGAKYLYNDDVETYGEWLFEGSGRALLTEATKDNAPPRTLACQIMDWSDDIAYSVHDLEDGIVSGYLRPATWHTDEFMGSIWRSVCAAPIRWKDGPPSQEAVVDYLRPLVNELAPWEPTIPMDIIRETTRQYINKFATAVEVEQVGDGDSLFDYELVIPEEVRVENQVLKSITVEYILRDHRTAAVFHKGEEIVTRLFETLFENTRIKGRERFTLFPREMRKVLAADRDNVSNLARHTSDYIASMTEGQAVHLYSRMFEPWGTPPHATY